MCYFDFDLLLQILLTKNNLGEQIFMGEFIANLKNLCGYKRKPFYILNVPICSVFVLDLLMVDYCNVFN